MILEELINIVQDSVAQIDKRVILDNADLASRRTIAHLAGAINNRLDDLDVIEK